MRVFHWLLALSFIGACVTAEGARWQQVHMSLGYTMAGLLAFRILWGLLRTRYARFANFVRGKAQRHIGHNPASGASIVLLLLLGAAVVGAGWAAYDQLGRRWLKELHEGVSNFIFMVVGLHVVGVMVSSCLHRENLVRAMVNGKKETTLAASITRPWYALTVLILISVLGFWWLQWQSASKPRNAHTNYASVKNAKNAKSGHYKLPNDVTKASIRPNVLDVHN